MNSAAQSLISEIETSLGGGPASQRSDVLRKVTDLFLNGADDFTTEQTGLFDDVFSHLIQKIERNALIELSGRLAPVSFPPVNVIQRLARDGDIEIAAPILEKSPILTDSDLSEIARTMGQGHLAAIAGRTHVSEVVTEILVDRGDGIVMRRVAGNAGAQFSRLTMASLLGKAGQDSELATTVAGRTDIPPELFEQFVIRATEAVRQRLLHTVHPSVRGRIEQVLTGVAKKISETEAPPRRPGASNARVVAPNPAQLREQLSRLARSNRSPETLTAFALCCDVPIASVKNIHRQKSEEGMIILGKAAGLGWQDLKDVFAATMPDKIESKDAEKALFSKFLRLSTPNAQRVVRFIRTSQKLSKDEIKKLI
ncbi:MAG: DUF2336 domain-containing protein [Xanthobacteraceae bacterium]